MTFFNNKEQVLKFELTPYGRYLLSQGKLRPTSYEFVDDDIMYDIQQVARSEIQNETYERIKYETPKLIPNPNKAEITPINYSNAIENFGIVNKHGYTLHQAAIGKSSAETKKTPGFSMLMLDGQISGTLAVYNGNSKILSTGSFENTFIPQFNFDLNYVLKRRQRSRLVQDEDVRVISPEFEDGKVMYIQEDNIMSFLKEFGSEYEKENFEIEVFEITDAEKSISGSIFPEALKTLHFETQQKRLQDGMITENVENLNVIELETNKLVLTYFELLVDDEIDPIELCNNIKDVKRENLYIDDDLVCPDDEVPQRFNIYATTVGASDLEDCD
jgi:hypothetical protein|tara:strand:+ start:418 stop:1410 length:993 start_codon:yes stop_codon:yes gene_type:complete